MATRAFRVGLRVADVDTATRFYCGLGFTKVGSVTNPQGQTVFAILERDGANLLVDALEGMPFPDTERERQIKRGPRGLGVAIGLGVDDLHTTLAYCQASGCQITSEPIDEAWGDRVFECLDPFGYLWEISQPITTKTPAEALSAVQAKWFTKP